MENNMWEGQNRQEKPIQSARVSLTASSTSFCQSCWAGVWNDLSYLLMIHKYLKANDKQSKNLITFFLIRYDFLQGASSIHSSYSSPQCLFHSHECTSNYCPVGSLVNWEFRILWEKSTHSWSTGSGNIPGFFWFHLGWLMREHRWSFWLTVG